MHTLSAWFTKNPVAANLIMLFVLIGGYFSLTEIRIEGFPALPPQSVTVHTVYTGVTPEQIDRSISQRILRELEGMPGIKRTSAVSSQGYSMVTVEKTTDIDINRFQNEIQSRIDSIPDFPQHAERPTITRDEFSVEAMVVQIYGATDKETLQKSARLVREKLQADPTIARIQRFGFQPFEIRIELDPLRLKALGLKLSDVAEVIRQQSLDYRTGSLKSSSGEIIIKADRSAIFYDDFINMPVTTLANGSRITLESVAKVIDGFGNNDYITRFNGHPAVGLQIFTTSKGHLLEVSEAAHRILAEVQNQLPSSIKTEIWAEYAVYMKDRLHLLKTNALQGLLIVFLLLALFLDLRLAFWVALGIPISISGAFIVMGERFLDYSLNDITTFGLIVVMGILVDDAVVVGESVYEARQQQKDPIKGTIQGVHKVSTATIFGCMTTIAAFYPLLLIQNDLARIFAGFSVVVIIALLASLLESKLILPAHLARVRLDAPPSQYLPARIWGFFQQKASNILEYKNKKIYVPLIRFLLHHRYSTLIIFITVGVIGIGAMVQGKIRMVFFPDIPGQIITVRLNMYNGSPMHLLHDNVAIIEKNSKELNSNLQQELDTELPPIANTMTAVLGENSAVIWAELQPADKREISTLELLKQWRDRVGTLEGVEELQFSGSYETGGEFIIEVTGRDEEVIASAITYFEKRFSELNGVEELRDDLDSARPRIRLELKKEAQHLGLSTRLLAERIGDGYGGLEVQRMQRDGEEVKVLISYEAEIKQHIDDLLQTQILLDDGRLLPITAVADIHYDTQLSSIYRRNGLKTVQVIAKLDNTKISASEAFNYIKNNIEPELINLYPGIQLRGAGEIEEMSAMQSGLRKALVLIFLLIYVLLAIPLKSYWQPVIMISVIPFGFVGAAIGHGLTGHTLSILSFFGMLAAMGIVVNDSLVMLTRYNQFKEESMNTSEALIQAGSSRFRAIFLTTVTTVCGLLPLLTETSEQAQYLIPAAVSLAFGELFATPITLCLIPLLIRVSSDFQSFFNIKKTLSTTAQVSIKQGNNP